MGVVGITAIPLPLPMPGSVVDAIPVRPDMACAYRWMGFFPKSIPYSSTP
jgi:hypothetical protein